MSQVISKRMINQALVRKVAENLANVRDMSGQISDREMLALSIGMLNADMRMSGKLPIESVEEATWHVMRAYRIALIEARALGRDFDGEQQ